MSSREASKKAAKELLALCAKEGVKVPTNPVNAAVEAGTMLNATRENGEFQLDAALKEMIKKFGVKESASPKKAKKGKADDRCDVKTEKKTRGRKRKADDVKDEDAQDDDKKAKKPRKKAEATCESNQPLADAFAELSGFEFKRGEKFKGGTWSKVAKAIRECETEISCGKDALKLKGVGKSSAAKIDEFLETGTLEKLEEYRAGNIRRVAQQQNATRRSGRGERVHVAHQPVRPDAAHAAALDAPSKSRREAAESAAQRPRQTASAAASTALPPPHGVVWGAGRRNPAGSSSSYSNKHKKPKHPQQSFTPCSKFLSGYGCPYGDKCHFSHDIRAFYPGLHEYGPAGYDDPIWSAKYAAPPRSHQSYPQRQMSTPSNPPMPKSDPARRHSSTFHMQPPRDRAASFAGRTESRDNQTDGVPMSTGGKMLFKEAVLRQTKAKPAQSKHHESSPPKATTANGYDDENSRTNREIATPENEYPDVNLQYPHHKHYPRYKKFVRGRKCASGDSAPSSVNGDSPKFCRNPKYLFSEVDGVDLQRAQAIQQLQQPQQQQYYSLPVHRTQMLNSPYSQYVTEEQFHSNLSQQVEGFVDYIDAQLASREMHQQQAIDSLQELVRSLWPDAMIDVYGSSYTRLALPVSDIDCVLVARSLAGEKPLTILEALAAEVERQPWTKELELLGSAKIPVLKMTYSIDPTQQDVLLDLTCGHSVGHTGLGARDLIYSFQAEMPALRPLVLILKSHLLRNDLKCAFIGGISSYVLVILVIRFLQACGDTHRKSFANASVRKLYGGGRRRSYSENASLDFPEELAYGLEPSEAGPQPKWCYIFSRNGRVTWRTGIGSLLMLFLETYITFDYRHFGISIENEGEFFLLPPEKVVSSQVSVVIPYVADPIKPGRSICNCFRMHEVIQAWLALYQNLVAGAPLAACIASGLNP